MTSPKASADPGDEVQLAALHLRVGMLSIALAELEELEGRGRLEPMDRSLLAEARWRSGDLEAAAVAARSHLDAGGGDPVALCIAAEAAAGEGRPGEARSLMDRLGPPDAATLDALFAGMPRRAFWPSAQVEAPEPEILFAELAQARPAPTPSLDTGPGKGEERGAIRKSAVPGPREVLDATAPGLWGDEPAMHRAAAASRSRRSGAALDRDPSAELAGAKAELAVDPDRALLRLALTLRLDPTLAPAVLDAVAGRTEPAADLVRGDAQRLLGRHLEAEAAFGSAAARLGETPTPGA